MTALDTQLRPLARRLIAERGKPMTLRRLEPATYSAATGTVTATQTDHAIAAVVEDYGGHQIQGLVRQGDRRVLLAADGLAIVPRPGDQIVLDGEVFTAVRVEGTFSGALPALYALQIRR